MLVTVVTMFGVCWLPLHLFNIHQDLDRVPLAHENDTWAPEASEAELFEEDGDADDRRFAVFMMVHWLAMSNSFVNPIIYGFLNDAFWVSSHINTIQYNTIQYNTIQYNTTQHNTTQYKTIQYNA